LIRFKFLSLESVRAGARAEYKKTYFCIVLNDASCYGFCMPLIEDFADFDAFKRCRDFTRKVSGLVRIDSFRRDPDLVRQIRRASVSILSNFAEGFEREGRQEFLQFLSFSKGSVGEIRAQLMYAVDEGYLEEAQQMEADHIGREATRLLGGLMKHLNKSEILGRKYLAQDGSGRTNRTTNRAALDSKLKTQNSKPKT
jgi:four helix bundle protein